MRYISGVTTLKLFEDRCTGCGMCAQVCPHSVIAIKGGRAGIADRDACMECGACSKNCPSDAIYVKAGVGCAQAVINSALGRKNASCCSLDDYRTGGDGCGCGSTEDEAPPSGRTGCC